MLSLHQLECLCLPFRCSSDVFDEKKSESFISIISSSKMTECRKSITLYDDQYKFFKAFNSQSLLIAFVEYMFEDVEPQWLNEQEKILFESLRVRMNNQKKKSEAWTIWWKKSHWWWRPENKQKTTEQQTKNKQKTSKKQAKKQAENNQVKVEDKDKEIRNINISISNDIDTEAEASEYWNEEINKCLNLIKAYNWWLVDWTVKNNRRFAKLLIDKLNKLESIQSWKYTWNATLEIILKVISQNKYHAPKITSPELIYRNLAILMQACKNDIWKQQNNIVLPTV